MSSVRLTICGAAQTVTGSKYLLETDRHQVLVDCGLFQGKKELRLRNWDAPPFSPRELSAVVLTHAHVDHSGYLPLLTRRGFSGPIYCTAATAELLKLLLPDTGHLQEEEARFANKKGTSKHKPAEPLFTEKDARKTLELLRPFEKNTPQEILEKITVEARGAGHILGSASLTIDADGRRITFSGDIGRYDTPILPDPEPVEFGDLLLCESTYGNRLHAEADIKSELAAVLKDSAAAGGTVLIPSFAVGRTQTLLYYIAELEREGSIPVIPVFVDSPMAVDATAIYRAFKHDFDAEATQLIALGETPLLTEQTYFCRSVLESKALNQHRGSKIIISASGMATGGRVLHHLRNLLPEERTTVLFVGYQAEGTRGETIQSGKTEVKIFGSWVPIRAKVKTISGLSAHADQGELLRWLKSSSGTPAQVRIVHGEPESASTFSNILSETLGWKAKPAEHLETLEL
jgi:metallo-beta-lactamase family protein